MKVIKLEVDESIFDKVLSFLKLLPEKKVKVSEMEDYSHIPYVSDEEQKDLEKTLKREDCHKTSHSKTISM